MSTMQAVMVDDHAPARLALGSAPIPQPESHEALVRVAAISLNRGEVRGAQFQPVGRRIGWDVAGTIEQAAADGTGFPVGTRVVGFVTTGGWAELVPVPTVALANLPDTVSFAQAATLPVAGLTALFGLQKGGSLIGRNVLITGASGGVGDFAVQLARQGGAFVVAQVRAEQRAERVRQIGADIVVVDADIAATAAHGPYHLVLDGIGGDLFSGALKQLAPEGIAVIYGRTAGQPVTFDPGQFFNIGGASIYGFIIFHELHHTPAGAGLARLAAAVAAGQLTPNISVEAPWSQIGTVAQRLLDRDYPGKAVLHVE